MSDINDYLNLVTSEYRQKPNFIAMISQILAVTVYIQNLLIEIQGPLYDISQSPVGDQLDTIGAWVGVSRQVSVPIDDVYFSWDGSDSVGWEYGVWSSGDSPANLVLLPDDVYLTLIKARIAANSWDGTVENAYIVWSIAFPNITLLIEDNQNMTMTYILAGAIIDSLTLALLTGGYLPLRPEGVLIDKYVVPIDTGPYFGWDLETTYIQGWEEGSWGIELAPS